MLTTARSIPSWTSFLTSVLLSGAHSQAATVSIQAVKVNDAPITPTNHVMVQPGDTITTEFYISNWNENVPGSRLTTFQLSLDRLGYISGSRGIVLPRGWDAQLPLTPCSAQADCAPEAFQDRCDEFRYCRDFCVSDTECPVPFPNCSPDDGLQCIGSNHAPGLYSLIDETRSDYVHAGYSPISAVDLVTFGFRFGGTTWTGDGPTDTGAPRYLGTVGLAVSPDACGTFTIDLVPEPPPYRGDYSFVELKTGAGDHVFVLSVAPVAITVACQTSACCVPRSDCRNISRAECAAHGGAWQEGQFCGEGDQMCPKLPRIRNPDAAR